MTNEIIFEKLEQDFPGHSFGMSGDGLLKIDNDPAYVKWEKITDIEYSDIELIKNADMMFYNLVKEEVSKYFENKSKK